MFWTMMGGITPTSAGVHDLLREPLTPADRLDPLGSHRHPGQKVCDTWYEAGAINDVKRIRIVSKTGRRRCGSRSADHQALVGFKWIEDHTYIGGHSIVLPVVTTGRGDGFYQAA